MARRAPRERGECDEALVLLADIRDSLRRLEERLGGPGATHDPPRDAAAAWIYGGVWASVVALFRVPAQPPTLPAPVGAVRTMRPAPGYLRYLKFFFWLLLIPGDVIPIIAWIAIFVPFPIVGMALAPLFLIVVIAPDVIAYVAIHLRYDTTWYVLTDRSLRIRRGIWVIHETTISFENVQNVEVRQGPVQRFFGIADVIVQTAGGGGAGHGEGRGRDVAWRARRHPAGTRRRRGRARCDPRLRQAHPIDGPGRRASRRAETRPRRNGVRAFPGAPRRIA